MLFAVHNRLDRSVMRAQHSLFSRLKVYSAGCQYTPSFDISRVSLTSWLANPSQHWRPHCRPHRSIRRGLGLDAHTSQSAFHPRLRHLLYHTSEHAYPTMIPLILWENSEQAWGKKPRRWAGLIARIVFLFSVSLRVWVKTHFSKYTYGEPLREIYSMINVM